ncbi:MAG: diguanylate cyclase [Lachnospiraceae bacterium]|nr:diguanylate cyclase [Lachnospiraceae bacterium]
MGEKTETAHIIAVDDDIFSLKAMGSILSENGMYVTALNSGRALLDRVKKGNVPDLVLLDIMMPQMDGFRTLRSLREYERESGMDEIPVIFLTADEDKEVEAKGFAAGAIDFIRKPFEEEALVRRIQNVLANTRKIHELSEEASTDRLTGLLNRESVRRLLERECFGGGTLFVLDLDSFKLVNDLYGHETGDRVLICFSELMQRQFRGEDIIGRIGGDEFIAFLKGTCDETAAVKIIRRLSDNLKEAAIELMGPDMTIPLGVSAGAVITAGGEDFDRLFQKADKSLLYVKQNGKHDCSVWKETGEDPVFTESQTDNLKRISMILEERNVDRHALWLGQEAFATIYRYLLRYIKRYREKAYKVLFTITPVEEDMDDKTFTGIMAHLGELIQCALRNSDIMMQSSPNQFFVFLPMVSPADIQKVIDRILTAWKRTGESDRVRIGYETEAIAAEDMMNYGQK